MKNNSIKIFIVILVLHFVLNFVASVFAIHTQIPSETQKVEPGILTNVVAKESKDISEIVKSADWSKMETIAVTLTEYKFTPSTLTFEAGTPYKLQVKNNGKQKHYFVSEDFFKAIATRKIQSTDGEIKAPYFSAIEVFPGRSLDLYFIPVKKGNYNLICTIKGHVEKGMVGNIIIK